MFMNMLTETKVVWVKKKSKPFFASSAEIAPQSNISRLNLYLYLSNHNLKSLYSICPDFKIERASFYVVLLGWKVDSNKAIDSMIGFYSFVRNPSFSNFYMSASYSSRDKSCYLQIQKMRGTSFISFDESPVKTKEIPFGVLKNNSPSNKIFNKFAVILNKSIDNTSYSQFENILLSIYFE